MSAAIGTAPFGADACPACSSAAAPVFIEEHLDRFDNKLYRLQRCPDCEVVFSTPREAVGADWYERSAPLRGREARALPESDWRFNQFLSERLAPGRLLDVGCGDGGFLRLAARAGFQGTGFDYDARVAARAREAGLDVRAEDFASFCKARAAGEFDVITLFDVLEHTPEPAWFFGELRRLLKPGGHVAITLPNGLRPLPWGREEHDFPPHHYTRWTPRALARFLEKRGFRVLRQEAGTLRLRYLSDHFFFYRIMPAVLPAAKRLLFGGAAAGGGTMTELYERSGGSAPLADPMGRQRAVEAARRAFSVAFLPAALAMKAWYRAQSPFCGDCLYTFARLERA